MTITRRVDKNQKRQEETDNKVEDTSTVNQSCAVQSGDSVRERISKSLWVHTVRLGV